ncbi:hypothetical protein AAL_08017 [Moelleriella libera RCEF 2490]|uniref:AA1-like domain-containing protein n=1 Tax=Moelleriella libera RCEF 2490 TaxID=1081109 RepID=A0A167WGD5_9HYPO|nr:hypothetical protein AAL_08017 [Moelleriella libera RCEF 2490]
MHYGSIISAAALSALARATITVVWQGGSCAEPTGPTIDISPEGTNACTLYNFFPHDDPHGNIQVTIKDTSHGLAVFQLPPSQEGQHIQCGWDGATMSLRWGEMWVRCEIVAPRAWQSARGWIISPGCSSGKIRSRISQ